jgi:hypothetical protein
VKDPVVKPLVRPAWAQSALTTDIVDPGNEFVAAGFPRSAVPPVRQILNWVLNYCTNAVRYLCRRGIADYDPAETYALHDVVRGDDNCLYQSLGDDNVGHVPSKSLVHWGPVGLHCRTAEEVAAAVVPVNLEYPELNVLRYGADNTGRSACDKAIADAVLVACPPAGSEAGARRVYFPAGQYLVTSPIDLSNSRANGTRAKDGLVIHGESVGATRIIGKTGAGRPVIETTGSQWLTIEDLTVTFAATDYSTVGIFQGLSKTLGETQNQKFSRLVISMCDDPAANGGAGTVGIWNFGAEENTYDTLWIAANLPLMFTAHNPSPNTGFRTPASYQSLAKSHSLGMSTFAGECFFVALKGHQPSIITEDANSMKFVNTYLGNLGGGGTNESAWKVYGSLDGLDYNGLVESHGRFLEVFGVVAGARVRATFGGIERPSTERILLQRGAQGRLLNSDFNFIDSVARERQIVWAIPLMPSERISCYIQNCTFKADCDQQFTTIQENVLANPSTGNITIESVRTAGTPYRYSIDSNRTQEVAIPDTKCRLAGISSAELIRLVLPAVYGNRNALSASISVEGMAYVADSVAGNMSCKFVRAQITVVVGNLGQVAVAADTQFSGSTASTNAERNDVQSLTIGAVAGDGGQFIRVIASPLLSGSENAHVNFAGTARLQWHGDECRAPRLQVPA